ncbi:hypothetical protein RI543_003840 [Arxiozyma heterogenica]|uniref:GATA-type domain-containing protein n=1 Tax=Arxiozyma heterogenica TaxID=278026 RepID=A0AAN7WNX8_9SACH|nr:hypothetical protein RI543_003840 [Kazachstania heterogenica]
MFSQIENGNMNIKPTVEKIGNKNGNPGYGGFDSMLEALPDDITFDTFFHDGLYTNSSNSSQNNLNGNIRTSEGVNNVITQSKSTTEFGVFNNITTTQPIDITSNSNNLQNGEIPQLWDFTTENFQMTPSNSSDSATISAPNSFSSEPNRSIPFASRFHSNNNYNSTITNKVLHGSSYSNQNLMNFLYQNSPSQHNNNILHIVSNYSPAFNNNNSTFNSFSDNKDKDKSDTITNKPISIPLTVNNTTNSIRKSQSFARQLSSTSLSSLNVKRNSSISELSTSSNVGSVGVKKPPIQCYNCKTFKTPLWRRDTNGNTLCNACGLFQKLHGTMRPLSLKTDVIKKRNSKKRMKKNQELVLDNNNSNSNSNNMHNGNGKVKLNNGNRRNNETLLTNLSNSSISKNIVPKSIVQPTATTAMTATTTTNSTIRNKTFSISDHSLLTTTATTAMTPTTTTTKMANSIKDSINSNKGNSIEISHINTMNSNGIAGNRRSSTSSNTSSRSSSSRSMVPILPKPPVFSTNNVPFNIMPHSYGSLSASTSSSSSPRYVAHYPGNNNNTLINGFPINSNSSMNQGASPLQASTFSTSAGRYTSSSVVTINGNTTNNGINILRGRNSRNASHSSSFVANSLHNLQNIQQQQSSANGNHRVTSPNISTSWNSYSNKITRVVSSNKLDSPSNNQQKSFETIDTNKESQQNSNSLSHTSLLSQQLQQNRISISTQPIPQSSDLQHIDKSVSMTLSNLNPSAIRNKSSISQMTSTLNHNLSTNSNGMTNSYSESVQFQRHGSLQQQQLISNYQSTVYSTLYQDSSQLRQEERELETSKVTKTMQEKVEDELEWLKFGI